MADSPIRRDGDALEERLKSALWLAVGRIVDEESIRNGVDATPQFIGALTELVWSQIESVSMDLEAFARHANRSTITVSDVMLLTRRNEGLQSILEAYAKEKRFNFNQEKEGAKKKRRL